MVKELTFKVEAEDDLFVAQCLDEEISSDGLTRAEAIANLQEALTLHFEFVEFALLEVDDVKPQPDPAEPPESPR